MRLWRGACLEYREEFEEHEDGAMVELLGALVAQEAGEQELAAEHDLDLVQEERTADL